MENSILRSTPSLPVVHNTLISTILLKINFRVSWCLTQVLELSPCRSLALSSADLSSSCSPYQKLDLGAPIHGPARSPFHTSLPHLGPSHLRKPGGGKTWFGFKQINTLMKPLQSLRSKKTIKLQNVTAFTASSCASHMAYIK